MVILVGIIEENARLLQWLVFFVSSTRSVHFFVQLFNFINLNYGRPKHTRNARNLSETKTSTFRTMKTMIPLGVFHTDFCSAPCVFFGFHQRVSSSFNTIFFNTMNLPKALALTFFGTVTFFTNLILKLFSEFFKISQGSFFNFLSYFVTNRNFTKPKRSLFSET